MEVARTTTTTTTQPTATSNNHNHSHLGTHLHHQEQQPEQQQQRMPHHPHNSLSVGLISNGGSGGNISGARSPFQREVREWQRIDPDTGALLTGRLEADRWINGPMNSYGKISDSQNISQPNGTQHTQRKQLEVLQARTANGAMQVIRSQTVQTTSSRWSSSTSTSASASASATASASSSPTIMGALTNGSSGIAAAAAAGGSHNNSSSLLLNNNHLKHSHFHSPAARFGLSMPPLMSTLDIREVNNGHSSGSRSSSDVANSDVDVDDADDDVAGHNMINAGDVSGTNNFFNRHSFLNTSHNSIGNSNLSLLLDTAPSLKLSNLMKSNSSISSNNSSSNNSTTTSTMKNNTHHQKSSTASKVSLHAIVGGGGESTRRILTTTGTTTASAQSSSSSSLSSATTATPSTLTWQQQQQQQQQQRSSRLFEQPTLYGNGSQSQSLTKSRVGVNADETGAGGASAAVGNVAGDDGDVRQRQWQQRDSMTPTQLKSRQPRRDLESFRHYNEHGSTAATTTTSASTSTSTAQTISLPKSSAHVDDFGNDDYNDDDDDDLLRHTKHHQRHQQPSFDSTTPLQRSRSISTDDLSSEWEKSVADRCDDEEPSEWRRVSKLRRSFQSSNSKSKNETLNQSRRPIDLPSNTVSVAKIRAELENGRRLNTAMRNNHVDLAALDSILNGAGESTKPVPSKRSSFLTAESLKEIRAGLKKLADESLYREDYVTATHSTAPDEHIEIQDVKKPPERIRLRQLTPEKSAEIPAPKSAFQVFSRKAPTLNSPTGSYMTQHSLPTGGTPKHTTHSLESRQKNRESTASIDWHLRRKSYGFEKMSPPDDKTMFRMDASTDSGLGRSGEQLGNWSPTESSAPTARGTVIHFGETAKVVSNAKPAIQKRYRQLKSPENMDTEAEQKRHSIAVDESQYMRDNIRKTSQVRLNGFHDAGDENTAKSLQPTRFNDTSDTTALNVASTSFFQRNTTQQKRVEFCKTEVHFAAESGRVNIVETDGKPPPTNNFRRRRRTTSGPMQTLMKSTGTISETTTSTINTNNNNNNITRPITHFGDLQENKTLTSTTVAYKASLVEPNTTNEINGTNGTTNVTFSTPKLANDSFTLSESSRSSYASTSGVDTTDNETDEISTIRGILKNKPIKPKPYHLGENIDNADALWGVQLRPIGAASKNELTKGTPATSMAPTSVAERVRIVEQRQDNASLSQTNGYSTKINLSLGDDSKTWPETGAKFTIHNDQRRPSLQEIMLQDLREHQRILDEGLKSTSLIIKTMRSANEFDEAMRRLSIASLEAAIIPTIVIPTPMLRSHSYQESSRRTSITSLENSDKHGVIKSTSLTTTNNTLTTIRRMSTDASSIYVQPPLVTPRLKLFGNTEIPVSQQLTQLRRLYDLAATNETSQDEDSADEEVKRYFNGNQHNDSSDSGGGTQESSSVEDERFIEYSGSWSRLKAKRTVWHIGTTECNKETKTLERAELPKSNVMSIELHSPQTSLERPDATKLIGTTPPVAQPRKITAVQNIEQPPRVHTATTVKQATELTTSKDGNRDFLKIVKETRGARKLREHELSYFGVQVPKDADPELKTTYSIITKPSDYVASPKRSLPQRKSNDVHPTKSTSQTESISDMTTTKQQATTKWQLLNDKPDLLRHSPIAVEPQIITRMAEIKPMERKSLKQVPKHDASEHLYENIATEIKPVFKVKSPTKTVAKNFEEQSYNRRTDLQRDAMILNEMTHTADQTMKALSDEAAIKDQRRRSLQRRNSKPLETINEKSIAEKVSDKCIAVQVTRSTLASEAKRSARHATPSPTLVTGRARSSSLSSNESCPRARSRSLSSEREYENVKIRPKRISTSATRSRTTKLINPTAASRSSSRESQRSAHGHCFSSGDDETTKRAERVRSSRSKHTSSTTADARKPSSKDAMRARDKSGHSTTEKPTRRDDEHKKRTTSSTTHSSRRERVECKDEVKSPQLQRHHHHHHHSKPNERIQHRSTETSSSRRHKDEHKSTGSSRTATNERDRVREHHRDSSQHRSSHRTGERSERDKDKEKSTRSKGHSSRSNQQKSERTVHEKQSATPTKLREHKKSTTSSRHHSSSEAKHTEPVMSTTHSKNASLQNGHHIHTNSHSHHHSQQNGHQDQHIHSMTSATITAKQREHRNGKDRK